jgi:hypothetical protein
MDLTKKKSTEHKSKAEIKDEHYRVTNPTQVAPQAAVIIQHAEFTDSDGNKYSPATADDEAWSSIVEDVMGGFDAETHRMYWIKPAKGGELPMENDIIKNKSKELGTVVEISCAGSSFF